MIDDEAAVRAIVTQTLQREGCEVVTASDAAGARRVAAGSARPFDLVLSDIVLPDEPGPSVTADVKARWPNVRVILMSGYSDAEESAVASADLFLAKPFTPGDVRTAVARLLRPR